MGLETIEPLPRSRITFTGVDVRTDLLALPEGVEIGVLYTLDARYARYAGQPNRYPAHSEAVTILERLQGRQLSLHICGKQARAALMNCELADMTDLVQRIQVNGKIVKEELRAICDQYAGHEIITQHMAQNTELVLVDLPNHVLLVDSSGGRGRSPDEWRCPNTTKTVGFAGGLGADNIRSELKRIQEVAVGDWWIDMESKLRDENDWFDVRLANAILEAVS